MTDDKVFKIEEQGNFIYISMNKAPVTSLFESYDRDDLQGIVDLLNELYNENEQLKKENRQLKHWNKCLAEKRHQELKGDVE